MKKLILSLAVICGLWAPFSWAADQPEDAAVDAAIVARITQVMNGVMPNFQVASVTHSVISGLYQVRIENGPLLLSTADASYFVSGDVFTTRNNTIENMSEVARKGERVEQLAAFSDDDLIVFAPRGKVKGSVSVFTDIQCGYCRKFHNDVPALNEMGIEVRYFSYPIFDGSREQMISALCAKDRQAALTKLKSGSSIATNQCSEQNIDAQFALAREFGLSGTPAIVLDDGTLLKGYVEPEQLASRMELK